MFNLFDRLPRSHFFKAFNYEQSSEHPLYTSIHGVLDLRRASY